jgi:hypothetical protein
MAEDPLETRITLRLPVVLRDALTEAATQSSRSMNGEIVFRLEEFDKLLRRYAETSALLERKERELATEREQSRKYIADMERVAKMLHEVEERSAGIEDKYRMQNFELREAQSELASLKRQTAETEDMKRELRRVSHLIAAFEELLSGAAEGNDAALRRAVAAFKSPLSIQELRDELTFRERLERGGHRGGGAIFTGKQKP